MLILTNQKIRYCEEIIRRKGEAKIELIVFENGKKIFDVLCEMPPNEEMQKAFVVVMNHFMKIAEKERSNV